MLFFSALVSGQAGKSYKYKPDGGLQISNIVSDNQSITINYSLSELNVESISNDEGSFYRVSIPGHTPSTDPGKPELPVLNRLIIVPEGSTCSIRITNIKSSKIKPSRQSFRGILIPSQVGETKEIQKEKEGFVIDKKIYSTRGVITRDTVTIEPLGKFRDKLLSNLIISPVRYNPRSNNLEVITNMTIEIRFDKSLNVSSKSTYNESVLFKESLSKGVLNYNPEDVINGYSSQPVKMVILTDTNFRKHLEPLYKWKTQKGYKLIILYKGPGLAGDNYTDIKKTLDNIYKSASYDDPAPEYLLIIGDISKVPYYGTGYVTDMYYGEFNGNGDYIPDMYIGRLPVKDTTEVKNVVKKIIQYEKFQFADTNNFYSRTLVATGKDESYANYMNGQVKYAITNYLNTQNKITGFHFYYPEGFTKKDSIMKLIKKGISFLNYTGHGVSSGWLHLDIKVPDIAKFNNPGMYPFVISNACRTAQFNDTTSFGNKIITASQKGAIGFIGCTNDSYWDEDFIWSIGPGTPSSDPKYSSTGLGAYDRLFHTHGESPSDWFISMGQVNYAGNLSVSSSSSARKKYYWETYTLLGDPSIIPIIGNPGTFNISLPDTLPNGIKSLSLTIDPFAYVAVSHFDTLWDASFASPSGSVVLDMPGLSNDSCLIVITGQNKIPIIKTIYFSNVSKEFINLSSSDVNDITGNNNGLADFGETFYLSLKISNLGLSDAVNLSATISSISEWVTVNNNYVFIGTLAGKSEIVLSEEFGISIANNVPDKGIATIDLVLKDNKTEKKYRIDIILHAPKLEIINCNIDDSVLGNHNYTADPGETFNLLFQIRNLGSSNISGQFNLSTKEENLTILDPSIKSGILQFGEITNILAPVKISESAFSGDYISLLTSLDCNPYFVDKTFSFRVGRIRESFESSNFRVFPWMNLSSKPWTITLSNSFDGSMSARSGLIPHNGTSTLMIRAFFSDSDSIKFYYKVSSEQNYDYLTFKINDTEIFRKSGETSWEGKAIPVKAGLNKIEWTYKKDNSVSQGADGAWLDQIDFSVSGTVRYIQRDIEVARIVSPVQKEIYGLEPVTVKVVNTGRDTINGFYLAFRINDNSPVKQYFNTKILPYSDSVTVTFDRRADLDLNGIYNILAYGYDNNDDYLANDTLSISIENTEIEETLDVFPNPFNEQFQIVMNSQSYGQIKLTLNNLAGKRFFSVKKEIAPGENTFVIDGSYLSPALYLLNISGDHIEKNIPLIKTR